MLDMLVEVALRSTVIAAVAMLALSLLRVRTPAIRHRVFAVVLFAMLALPAWIAWGPQLTLPVLPSERAEPTAATAAPIMAPSPRAAAQSELAVPLPGSFLSIAAPARFTRFSSPM